MFSDLKVQLLCKISIAKPAPTMLSNKYSGYDKIESKILEPAPDKLFRT